MSNLINYDQFKSVFEQMKTYIDSNIQHTQELSSNNSTAYTDSVKEEIYDKLANEYASLETFQNYSDSLSTSFQLLQYGMNLKFESTGNSIDDVYEEVEGIKKDLYTNIKFDTAGLVISQKDSPYSVDVSEKEITFMQDKQEIVKIANNKLIANKVVIDDTLDLGAFRFIPKRNGHLSLSWNDDGNLVTPSTAYPEKTISATNNTTLHTFQLKNAPVEGQVYTFELCADIPDRGSYYSIYSGSTLVESIYSQEFNADGIGRKSFRWEYGEATQLSLCFTSDVDVKDLTITSIKMYIGDEYWDNSYNLLSYNNMWNNNAYIWNENAKYTKISDNDMFEQPTSLYARLEPDTDYMFSCKTDCGWGLTGYNYIEDGGFSEGLTNWRTSSDNIEEYTDSEYNKENTIYLYNASSDRAGIFQRIDADSIAPGTEITVSFDIDWESNVKDCEGRIQYYSGEGEVITEESVILNKVDGHIYSGHVETTLTTIDNYSYFNIFFVHAGCVDNSIEDYRIMTVSNVKLEVGDVATDFDIDADSVFMRIIAAGDNSQYVELTNPCLFRVSSAGVWKLNFYIVKGGVARSFWDAKIAKVEVLDEEEFINEGAEDILEDWEKEELSKEGADN